MEENISKRDYLAGCALQGLLSKLGFIYSAQDTAESATEYADALIEHLDNK